MQLQLQSFSALVSNAAAAVQGAASQLIDLTVGSTLRAILEANASMALWLQWLILQVLRTTRAATSDGTDLDTWMADYAFGRLPSAAATGQVTFSRFVASATALIPVSTPVRTTDGSQTFLVQPDASNGSWSAAQNGFVMGVGLGSVSVPVQASAAGIGGNVRAGAIALLGAALPGVDSVSNVAPLGGGVDAEPDTALRVRFQNYLASLSQSTSLAIWSAVSRARTGLSFIVMENVNPDGSSHPGHFVIVVDDGTGNPSAALITNVARQVDAVRPVGTSFGVIAPVLNAVGIALTVTSDGTVAHTIVAAAVANAIATYVNALSIGATLSFSRLTQLAYAASAAVNNVTNVTLNGAQSDVAPVPTGVIRSSSIVVS